MKKIKLKYVDFWPGFDEKENYFSHLISESFAIELSDDPDFIIYSVFGSNHLKYDCIRIFFTGENIDPDFNLCDYAIGFSHIEYGDRYLRYPLYLMYEGDFQRALQKHLITEQEIKDKDLFCDFIYSNNNAENTRIEFFHKLSQYKRVESGGGCLNNVGYRVPDKFEFQSRCKFSIAFENSSTPGYTTEKIVQSFAAKTIPIYWGNPLIERDFNPNSFINCHSFNSFEEVIDEISKIDQNDNLYLSMIKTPILPALEEEVYHKRLLRFFSNIFNQPFDDAKRRTQSTRMQSYEHRMRFSYLRSKRKILKAILFSLFSKRHR